jgi:hypothetical protein
MKLFVLVRKDLSTIQQAVQAGHAIAEFMKEHRDTLWTNGTLVYLGVNDLDHLTYWGGRLKDEGISHSVFFEPDVSSETALAFRLDVGVVEHKKFKRRMDDKLRLLKFQ